MRVIGLTGGIASGKTTVQRMFADLGAAVLDADQIYHHLIAPTDGVSSSLVRVIASRFSGVIDARGQLDRRALANLVFADDRARADLEGITHPAILRETNARIAQLEQRAVPMVIYDAPLFFEAGLFDTIKEVIVVWVPRDVQIARLMARDGMTRDSALVRLRAQMPLDEKRRRATWVIDASKRLEATRDDVTVLWQAIGGPES